MALAIILLVLVAWGALSFGAVYDWAYLPLAAGCALVGAWTLVRRTTRSRRGTNTAVLVTLLLTAAAIGVQLIPLERSTIVRLSPATDEFLRQYDLGYAMRAAMETRDRGVTTPGNPLGADLGPIVHPLSINPAKTRLGLLFLGAFALLLFGLTRSLGGRDLRTFVPGLAAFGVVLSIAGVVQKALWNGKVYGFWEPINANVMPFGPFINRNHFAGWMLMAIPLVLGLLVARSDTNRGQGIGDREQGKGTATRERRGERASRVVLLAFSVVVMTLALALTMSRSGIACLLVAMLLAGVHILRRPDMGGRQRWLAVYVGAAFVAAIGWAGFDAIASRFAEMDIGLGGRAGAWADAWRIHGMFPVFGTGFNTYGTATLLLQQFQTDVVHFVEAHNDYLQVLTEGGYLIALPFLALIVSMAWQIGARFRENLDDRTGYWLRLGAVTGLVAIAFQEVVEFSLQMPGNFVLFTVLCAIAMRPASGRSRGQDRDTRRGNGQGTRGKEQGTTDNEPADGRGRTHAVPARTAVSALLLVIAFASACGSSPKNDVSVKASYSKSGTLELLTYDTNKDGTPDTWAHMDGSRLVRMEVDKDFNGVVDRWEYFTPAGVLEKVGMSRANDGKPDAWAYPAPDGTTARIDVSPKRDGRITRQEFYEKDQLSRVEEDTDGNGRVDKWETYEGGTLASVALDTDGRGTPDRKLVYGADGVTLKKLR